jgi:hypothetical protein
MAAHQTSQFLPLIVEQDGTLLSRIPLGSDKTMTFERTAACQRRQSTLTHDEQKKSHKNMSC